MTGAQDHAEGNISLITPKGKAIIWSSEAGDRSLWKGMAGRGGTRNVAKRLGNNLKETIRKN